MSRAKENASLTSRLRSERGALVTSDSDSLETLAPGVDGQVLVADSTQPNGIKWDNISGIGTVTNVEMTVPTGLTVTGSPITSTGSLDVAFDTGYSIPTTTKQGQWDVAVSHDLQWSGGATNLNATTGRTSLGLGDSATKNVGSAAGTVAAGDDSRFLTTAQLTDLTDSGASTLHYHASDRDLANATGTLAIANGGTGNTTAQAAINALTQVSLATAGQVLTKSGTDATWVSPAGAGLGDVTTSGSAVTDNLVSYFDTTGDVIKDTGIASNQVVTLTGTQTLTNKTLTAPVVNSPTGIVKADVGLSNVDNTSDATKNSATATLTNKTMSSGCTWTGAAVGPTYGGTGQTSWTKGDILYASGTNTLSKLPVGTVGQALVVGATGVPQWSASSTASLWGAVSNYDGGEATPGSLSIGRNNPLHSRSATSTLRIGHGTSAAPASASSPAIWQESWVDTDYASVFGLGLCSDATYGCHQGVTSALFQTFKRSGQGGVNAVIGFARADSNTVGDIIGIQGRADGKDRTSGPTTYGGMWAAVETPSVQYGFGAYGLEVNAFAYFNSSYYNDPFAGGSKVTGIIVNNYQKAGTPGNYLNSFGIAITSNTGGTRAFGYQTGLYITEALTNGILIRGGTYGSATNQTQYGIKFEGTKCAVAGIALGDNKINWGGHSGTLTTSGDMFYNSASGVLWFRDDVGSRQVVTAAAPYAASGTATYKVPIKYNGTTYYVLATTVA